MIAILRSLQQMVFRYYHESGDRSYDWAGQKVGALRPQRLLDVGCGDGQRLLRYLTEKPSQWFGVERHPTLAAKAREVGIKVLEFDLNGRWPLPDAFFEVIHAAQVIEHLHNTRLFVEEMRRVLVPGGWAILTSENLTSWLNLAAMILGYTPFSLQQTCGWYLGNPMGLHAGEEIAVDLNVLQPDDPAFSGVSGHVRVLGVRQARELFIRSGFAKVEVRTIGLLPLPVFVGRRLERWIPQRGHWLLIAAQAPSG
ncbi:MAG: class I SAM-dependent methyltransferase [Kiritimatiellae bacterium]|nr:class I SAM-dependent methyltransferase [Kiritimatiellia bacterium]